MKKVCVFCSASLKLPQEYYDLSYQFGKRLAENGLGVVYGGSTVGMMGKLADGALSANGHVVGVIPDFLKKREIQHHGLSEIHHTQDMHQRKRKMYDMTDCFVALPGGYGTLDESFEAITWNQLGQINKPLYFINYKGFYDFIKTFHQRAEKEFFIKSYENYQAPILNSVDEFFQILAEHNKNESNQ